MCIRDRFQIVLDIVHAWYLKGFRDLLVHGQLALPYDFERDVKYFVKYCAKPENIYYRALRQVFCELSRFFVSVTTCSLTLHSSGTILYCLLHVMSQLIKQLLTWYLTHDMQLRDVTAFQA